MEASRWTDARIDDLNDRVSGISADVRHQSDRIDKMGERIDALQHTIVVVGGGLFAAFVSFLVAMVGLIITLLVTYH
jgi:hypothetical protein